MDIEKALKLSETYLREYLFFIIETFLSAGPRSADGQAGDMTNIPKIWLFAVISIVLGIVAFGFATNRAVSVQNVALVQVLFTLWMWILFAVITHFLVHILRGIGSIWDTFFAILCVMPSAYVVSAFLSLTLSYFFRAAADQEREKFWSTLLFILVQFLIISFYLSKRITKVHKLSLWSRVILSGSLPVFVLGVNTFFLLYALGGGFPVMGPLMLP